MAAQQQLVLKKFNPKNIPNGAVCVFIGKRKSGKSYTIKDILYHKRDIPIGQIISGSEKVNPFFSDFFPSSFIADEYTDELLNKVFKRQEQIKQKSQEIKRQNIENKKRGLQLHREIDSRFLIVFDDCLHDSSWKKSKPVKHIFMNGRHFDIFFILAMQYVIGIPPNLRGNVDYVFIFRDSSIQNRKKIFDNFGGVVGDFQLFSKLMDSLDKYECLVLCNDADKIGFQEQVMYYKAGPPKDFRLCNNIVWKKHEEIMRIKDKYMKPDMSKIIKPKNSLNVNIIKQ